MKASLGSGYEWTALLSVCSHKDSFMFISIANPRTAASKQLNITNTYSFPSSSLISVMSATHFFMVLQLWNPALADCRICAPRGQLLQFCLACVSGGGCIRFLHGAVNCPPVWNMDVPVCFSRSAWYMRIRPQVSLYLPSNAFARMTLAEFWYSQGWPLPAGYL